ncbi:MMPL family transporter [Phytohabitans sp. ZYX-F-186]|uniref:MMPL family transporter n=1 Tax=Phytohabitans maris TaxID=3071409 RepID=A0ABU0ZQL7_9ACTN|nr:MMPL family transporter [Phytohabitans sp. ZYX-F-186]MDQ7909326.1 MMPL family transporter [Phytohabitans sp. ZYX-F-186]
MRAARDAAAVRRVPSVFAARETLRARDSRATRGVVAVRGVPWVLAARETLRARDSCAARGVVVARREAVVLSPDRMLQQFGLGLAVAVLLDAVVIRCLVLPAVMHLLGARAWWLPGPIARVLPRLAIERPATE